MASMLPPTFPHDLGRKPRLAGEAKVFAAVHTALDDDWWCFYDRAVAGSRRRVDMLALHPGRGVLAIEVKGGMVYARRGHLLQQVAREGTRKRIDPFGQLKRAVAEIWALAGLRPEDMPVHGAIWFPEMGQAGLRWPPSPHILTRETLAPDVLAALVERALPVTTDAAAAVWRLIGLLEGQGR
jgi:hypothetical protein